MPKPRKMEASLKIKQLMPNYLMRDWIRPQEISGKMKGIESKSRASRASALIKVTMRARVSWSSTLMTMPISAKKQSSSQMPKSIVRAMPRIEKPRTLDNLII